MNRISQALLELRDAGPVLEIHSPDYSNALCFPAPVLEKCFKEYLSRTAYRPDPRGELRAREAVSRYYKDAFDVTFDPDDILLTCGTSESYAWILRALGHEAAVPVPSYPLLENIIEYCGSMQKRCNLTEGYQIDEIPGADVALLVSPHNPSGTILTAESLRKAAEAVQSRKGAVVFDEVFSSFIWDNSDFARPAGGLSFTLNGVSKLLCLPWLKLSWIVAGGEGKKSALEKLELISDTFLPVNGFAQDALPELFSAIGEFHPAFCGQMQEMRRFAFETLSACGLRPALPSAGFSMVLTAPPEMRPELTDEEFAIALLREERVLVHPGYLYDFAPEPRRFVVSFQNKKGLLEEAFHRMAHFCARC